MYIYTYLGIYICSIFSFKEEIWEKSWYYLQQLHVGVHLGNNFRSHLDANEHLNANGILRKCTRMIGELQSIEIQFDDWIWFRERNRYTQKKFYLMIIIKEIERRIIYTIDRTDKNFLDNISQWYNFSAICSY